MLDPKKYKTYIVSPYRDRKAGGVFNFAFDSDAEADAEKFAADVTRLVWDLWHDVGCPSGFSGCEGLKLYLLETADGDPTKFYPTAVFVQGQKYAPYYFDFDGLDPIEQMQRIVVEEGKEV